MVKSEKEFEKYVNKVIAQYIPMLLLQRHTFELIKGVENQDALMEAKCQYPYLNATIRYSKECFQKWVEGKDIIPYVVHEMCHTITDPLYSKANARYVSRDEILDERENLTDLICNIVLNKKGKI